MQPLVTIATYNERENLQPLIEKISALTLHPDILIIDDNSPDGTGQLADRMATDSENVSVLHRPAKQGLGIALRDGFRWALDRQYETVINLDGDHSHNPDEIVSLCAALAKADLVIGSRYFKGIRVINWPPRRLILSLAAARFVRAVTGMEVCDPTSGFRAYRHSALQEAIRPPNIAKGFSFHIECLHKVWRSGLRLQEVPILFADRVSGKTKMSYRIVFEAIWITLRLRACAGCKAATTR